MKELGITTMIYNRDMKTINEINTKQFYELAKANPLTVISECVNDLDRILKECWKIHDDSETNANDRLVALRTISEINDKKLSMSQEMLDNYHHDRDLT